MLSKIKAILNSVRFWQLVGAGIVIWLQTNDWKLGVISILGGSTLIGTIDKATAKK